MPLTNWNFDREILCLRLLKSNQFSGQKRSLKKSTDNYLNLDGTSNDANRSELSFNDAEAIKTNITKLETVHFLSKLTGNSTNNEQVGTSTVGSKSVGLLEPLKITTPNPKRGLIILWLNISYVFEKRNHAISKIEDVWGDTGLFQALCLFPSEI